MNLKRVGKKRRKNKDRETIGEIYMGLESTLS